ncbi:hypothetical protein [Deinococcus multiflagellatus]|uniref:Uncharacterized protein n=1 Tax=Deinococcus multiflagellatus TaxID=1656887 RepID=A0ABW1ZPR6_9DEIO
MKKVGSVREMKQRRRRAWRCAAGQGGEVVRPDPAEHLARLHPGECRQIAHADPAVLGRR